MRVVVHEFISLDGVVQGPGKPGGLGEDTTGTGVQVCRYQPAR
jgi:hypothetical protein